MAQDPSAAQPGQRSRTARSDAARRRTTVRRRIAVGAGVVAALGLGAFLLSGGDVPIPGIGSNAPAEFAFELRQVKAQPLGETKAADLREETQQAGDAVKETMDELYSAAFVDPGSWGDYGAVYELFDGEAADGAESDTDVLTLGTAADEEYESLRPSLGTLSVVVLTDRRDAPVQAIAEVRFEADARLKDGSSTSVTSVGSFFLQQVEGRWRIIGYRIDRNEEAMELASPTEEAS